MQAVVKVRKRVTKMVLTVALFMDYVGCHTWPFTCWTISVPRTTMEMSHTSLQSPLLRPTLLSILSFMFLWTRSFDERWRVCYAVSDLLEIVTNGQEFEMLCNVGKYNRLLFITYQTQHFLSMQLFLELASYRLRFCWNYKTLHPFYLIFIWM